MIFDDSIPITRPTEEEVIMKTNAEIISYISEALGNVETGKDSISLYDIEIFSFNASAKEPKPEPRITPVSPLNLNFS